MPGNVPDMREFMPIFFFTAFFCVIAASGYTQPQYLYLNEVMASNAITLHDEDGDYSDWIELYYAGEEPLELWGYGLSDNGEDLYKWVIPQITMHPGEFLVIWASGKDRTEPGRELHTNFRIAQQGEEIILTDPHGTRIDELAPVTIPTDISLGRKPDGTGDWFFFQDPTPGASNTGAAHSDILEKPVLSHHPGFYDRDFQLTLSHPDPGATIYYTLDGSRPDTNAQVFTGEPIPVRDRTNEPNQLSVIPTATGDPDRFLTPNGLIKKGTVIRALAVRSGSLPSDIITGTYIVDPLEYDRYSLPVVSIVGDSTHFFSDSSGIYVPGDNIPANFNQRGKCWERPVHFELFDKNGTLCMSQDIGVRIHGGASRMFRQKSLRLYARNEYGDNRFYHTIFPDQPYDAYNRLILRNSGNDWQSTMFRDALAQRLVRHFDIDTQAYRPVILFLNGEYWGIHNIRERYDRHYLERVYDIDPDNIDLLTYRILQDVEVKEGDAGHFIETLQIAEEFDAAHTSIMDALNERMDLDQFIDYYSAQIYFGNYDWPQNNIDFWRLRIPYDATAPGGHDGRWRWLLYDTDFAFGMYRRNFDMVQWLKRDHWSTDIFRSLLEDETFRHRFLNRLADHLNTTFRSQRVLEKINAMAEIVRPEISEHIDRWRMHESIEQWEADVNIMREFAANRPASVREHVMSGFNIEQTHRLTVTPFDPAGGAITVNSKSITADTPGIPQDPWPWTGEYFEGIPVTLEAVPPEGQKFSHWESATGIYEEPVINVTLTDDLSLKAVFVAADPTASDDPDSHDDRPVSFHLEQNHPNPFNPVTVIRFDLPDDHHVVLEVFDLTGRKVATLLDQWHKAGSYQVTWDASLHASGLYFYRIRAGDHVKTRSMTLVK